MIKSESVNDYYIDSNELRILVQRLKKSFEQVFELSLNTSLVTGKLQGEVPDAEVYEVFSSKVESIAKNLRKNISEMNQEANTLTRFSLENKQSAALLDKFHQSQPYVSGENNKISLAKAIERLENQVLDSMKQALEHKRALEDKLSALTHLNEKIWLTLSQLKVQVSNSMENHERNANMESVIEELSSLSDKIDYQLNQIHDKMTKLQKSLDSNLEA